MKKAFYLAALLSLFSPLAIDMYLGLMSVIEGEFHASASLTLSVFLFGLGVGQILFGLVNDKKGLPFLIVFSLIGYILTSGAIFLFTDYLSLLISRFGQGVFAGGLSLSSILFIDRSFQGNEKQKYLGYQQSIMNAIPATAPAIGTFLYELTGSWRATFLVLFVIGIAFLFWLLRNLSIIPKSHATMSKKVSFNKDYIRYGIISILSLGGLFTYVSAYPFVIDAMGLSKLFFLIAFAFNAVFIILGGIFSGNRSNHWSSKKLLTLGILLQAISAMIIFFSNGFYWLSLLGFAMYCFSFPITIANAMAMSLSGIHTGHGKLLGYITCLQMCAGGLGGYLVTSLTFSTAMSFAFLLALYAVISIVLIRGKTQYTTEVKEP
ncbi:MFS transporter [Marinomonas spartinae]|uniref:MFS transporter n=1 Tax=Marinomonas spartinae TaxID=1792290 RepID=UPI0018F21313|nr:MFS transporter [Marinomonas spartinae]MBJ7556511.1 MFS transporter [Marinomonas spartinae]